MISTFISYVKDDVLNRWQRTWPEDRQSREQAETVLADILPDLLGSLEGDGAIALSAQAQAQSSAEAQHFIDLQPQHTALASAMAKQKIAYKLHCRLNQ